MIDLYYKPRMPPHGRKLADLFLHAEDAYFGQWDPKRFAAPGRTMPGELHLTDLFGTSPGPARYLLEPFLDARRPPRVQEAAPRHPPGPGKLEGKCDDGGRLERNQKAITVTLTDPRLDPRGEEGELRPAMHLHHVYSSSYELQRSGFATSRLSRSVRR